MSKLHEKLNGKNINFLIGSGASVPIFKTLYLGKDKPTFEELLTNSNIKEVNKKAIYYYYYKNWIKPMKNFKYESENGIEIEKTLKNYYEFVKNILDILDTNGNEKPKRANIFTTNYDLLFENTFEKILKDRSNCYFNDGSRGFISRTLSPQSYNLIVSEMGYYDNYKKEISTINLFKMHGSVNWTKKDNYLIEVLYKDIFENIEEIPELEEKNFEEFIEVINNEEDISLFNNKLDSVTSGISEKINRFYNKYEKLAIINPNKWKFHDTVFEQHYYQLIRNFSYELEKPNTILIVFAFSFSDEHIEEIFKRSLGNPELEVLIICYSEIVKKNLKEKFMSSKNISYYPKDFKNKDGNKIEGNFTYFNNLFIGDYDELL